KLEIRGPMLAKSTFYVMARPAKVPPKPRPHPTSRGRERMFNASFGPPPKPALLGATFEHIVGPTKPITGVVRSKATGRPIEGALVAGQEAASGPQVSAVTDSQGRFRLVGLPKGEFYQVAAGPGRDGTGTGTFLRAEVTLGDTEGLKPLETALELPSGV